MSYRIILVDLSYCGFGYWIHFFFVSIVAHTLDILNCDQERQVKLAKITKRYRRILLLKHRFRTGAYIIWDVSEQEPSC